MYALARQQQNRIFPQLQMAGADSCASSRDLKHRERCHRLSLGASLDSQPLAPEMQLKDETGGKCCNKILYSFYPFQGEGLQKHAFIFRLCRAQCMTTHSLGICTMERQHWSRPADLSWRPAYSEGFPRRTIAIPENVAQRRPGQECKEAMIPNIRSSPMQIQMQSRSHDIIAQAERHTRGVSNRVSSVSEEDC